MPKILHTRERLIESARYLFWERGFAGTSMTDLLGHADVNSGSFYHFFESKEALLRAVLEEYLQALRPMVVDPAFAQSDDPVERIFAILAGYRGRILQTDCKYGCPLGRLALEIDPENRPAHKLIADNFQGWIGAVRECVEQMKDGLPKGTDREALALEIDPENRPAHKLIADNFQGWIAAVRECVEQMKDRLPKDTDREALATYVLAVMEGGVMLSRSYGSVEPFDRAVRQLRQHFDLLLGRKPGRASKVRQRSAGRSKQSSSRAKSG